MSKTHNLNKTEIIIEKPSVDHTTLEQWLNNKDEINGFIGWVEVDASVLDEDVPKTFPNRLTPVMEDYEDEETYIDENGNQQTRTVTRQRAKIVDGKVVTRPKTILEYAGGLYHESVNKGKVLIPIGERNERGNRLTPVQNDEFMKWVDYFSIDIIKTKSEGKKLMKPITEGE